MNQSEYEALCRKAEMLAEQQPLQYRWKLRAYSWFGHVVLISLLILLVLTILSAVWASFYSVGVLFILLKTKFVFLVIPIIWLIASALWVKFDQPTGYRLRREKFPALFAEIDELQASSKTGMTIHQLLLTDEFNASLIQTPRLGVLGWQHNTLTLGLPLLLTMSKDQARAVIAHELGHLAGGDSAFTTRIYRSRITWEKVMHAFSSGQSLGQKILNRFFAWYAPRFSAYSFALARQNEYEADMFSARLTSTETAASALVAAHTFGNTIIDRYWEAVSKSADHKPQPSPNPWQRLATHVKTVRKQDIIEHLHVALSFASDYSDTHPSLKQRLKNLGVEPVACSVTATPAAVVWFGEEFDQVVSEFDARWINQVESSWSARYEYVSKACHSLKAYERRSLDDLCEKESWEKVLLWSEFKSADETVRLLNAFLKRYPGHLDARFLRGSYLYRASDKNALIDFEYLVSNRKYGVEAGWMAYQLLSDLQQKAEAEKWRQKAEVLRLSNQRLIDEHSQVKWSDPIIRADITEQRRQSIEQALKASGLVKKAWLAEKRVSEKLGDNYIIVISGGIFAPLNEAGFVEKVQELLPPYEGWLILKSGDYKKLSKKVMQLGERLI